MRWKMPALKGADAAAEKHVTELAERWNRRELSLMSVCTRPMVAAKKAVAQPTVPTTIRAVSECVKRMCERATT